jgi:hypothetical protein
VAPLEVGLLKAPPVRPGDQVSTLAAGRFTALGGVVGWRFFLNGETARAVRNIQSSVLLRRYRGATPLRVVELRSTVGASPGGPVGPRHKIMAAPCRRADRFPTPDIFGAQVQRPGVGIFGLCSWGSIVVCGMASRVCRLRLADR